MSKPAAGVDSSGRRKWDVEAHTKKQEEERMSTELEQELAASGWNKKGPAAPRAPLRARDVELHLDEKVGTVQVVTTTGDKQAGGFYCDVCQCTVRDSTNYVDHLNGKRHQKALGMSMRAPRSTLDQIKAKLAAGKRKEPEVDEAVAVRARLAQAEEEAQAAKQKQKDDRKQRKEEYAAAAQAAQAPPKPAEAQAPAKVQIAALPPQVQLTPKVEVIAEPLPGDEFAGMGLPMNFGTSKKGK